ncbi:putative manganese-dependent inorganic diphosphatase [Anaeroselena agilis]|uniref:inorganic diphosphatase n=1 Tax=Anaeroselena agilis TaxID=3063788 RepID=A0ABU3NTR9_9FIRM|nr:putative manganese-dependent inorganic diphosphatase [Selenomonadales bacterium 4137-cl]
MAKPLYVIGHRNPDTDSICSAIAYAHLKKALGEEAVPARAGKINAETKFVLDYFAVEAPVLVTDLHPRADDVMHPAAVTIRPEDTLRELGTVIKRHGVKSVPVVAEDGRLAGIVSVGDLAKRYIEELEMQDLKEAGVTFAGVVSVLDGKLAVGEDPDREVAGKVWIGAAKAETMARVIKPGGVVLVGNREEAQLACIACGISCLIVTGGARVSPAVRDAAGASGAVVIVTPHDTYTAARLLNQSVPVRMVMQREVVAFSPGDLVAEIKNVIVRTKHRNYPVVDQGRLVGILDRDRLIVPEREKVILVDHNERSQAVEGIEEANIVEIIDHHRLGGLETGEPIFIRHEPVGSTATIVANMFWHRGVEIPAPLDGLLLAAVLSDTVLFRSPTATAKDRDTARRLADAAGVDIDSFGQAMFEAGSAPGSLSPGEIIASDLKEFQIGEYRVAIAQVSVMDPGALLAAREKLQAAMEALGRQDDYDLVVLMVTDIVNETSHLVYAGQATSLIPAAFGKAGAGGVLSLPGVMSRKKQVVPPLVEATRG